MSKMSIRIHESKKSESVNPPFLPESLKDELWDELPCLYTADGLAIFQGSEELDPELAWNIENLDWDVAEAKVHDSYLMVAFKDNPGADFVKETMAAQYKMATLGEALGLVQYLDVSELRKFFGTRIVGASEGKPWELGYYMGDINDTADVPGIVDAAYTDDGSVCIAISAFNYTCNDFANGQEITETRSTDEALKLVEDLYNKYGTKEEPNNAEDEN